MHFVTIIISYLSSHSPPSTQALQTKPPTAMFYWFIDILRLHFSRTIIFKHNYEKHRLMFLKSPNKSRALAHTPQAQYMRLEAG